MIGKGDYSSLALVGSRSCAFLPLRGLLPFISLSLEEPEEDKV